MAVSNAHHQLNLIKTNLNYWACIRLTLSAGNLHMENDSSYPQGAPCLGREMDRGADSHGRAVSAVTEVCAHQHTPLVAPDLQELPTRTSQLPKWAQPSSRAHISRPCV